MAARWRAATIAETNGRPSQRASPNASYAPSIAPDHVITAPHNAP